MSSLVESSQEEEKFVQAPAIFPNNDSKYAANKQRAHVWAECEEKQISYSVAKDKPTAEALRERPDLPAHKVRVGRCECLEQ